MTVKQFASNDALRIHARNGLGIQSSVYLEVKSDPLGPTNKIVSLRRHPGGHRMKSMLYPIGVGDRVTMGQDDGFQFSGPSWHYFAIVDSSGTAEKPMAAVDAPRYRPPYWYVDVNDKRIMEVDEWGSWPPVVPTSTPWRKRLRNFYRRNTGRNLADRVALKLGYVPDNGQDDY